jgi:O-antigen/teichoic acid export membrane protein
LVTYLANEGDTLLVGKTLGTTQLGFYNQAWTAANLVNRNVTGVVGKVAMPALSSVAEDPERLRNALNRMMRLLALASFPLLIGLLVVADLFVLTLYGPKWEASILPLQILIIYALRQSVGSSAAVIYNVVGRPDIGFKMGLTFLPFYGLSIWLGSFYGIVGVAVGVTAARTLYGVIQFAVVARLVGQTLTQLLANFGQPLLAAITLGFLVCGYRWLLYMAGVSGAILLGVLVLLGGITWIVLLVRLFPRMCEELVQMCESFSGEFGARVRRVMSPMMA